MSELNPTPKFWRAPVGFGLGALVLAIAIATTDFNPLWSIPAMAVVFMTFRGTASALHRRSYLRQLSRKVDRVPLAGLTPEGRGMRLTDVYIDVAVKPAEGPDSSERPFIGTGFWPDRRPPFLTALCRRRSAPIVIVGEPGSGKTTVLRRTVLELTRHHRLPILIDLPSLSGTEPPDLPQLVRDSYWLTRRPPDGWLRRQLTAGHCVVMLDGLDELASEHDRQRVADWIEAQRQNYPKNSFVITTRPDGLTPGPLPDAEFWQLRHLTDSQIASFLHDWCETVEKRKSGHNRHWARDEGAAEAGVLLSRLRAKPVLHQLAAHPLPLTLIALVHRHCGFLPDDRQALYNDAAALLVNGHADSVHRLAGQLMEARTTRLSSRDITAIAPQLDPRELIAEGSAAGWLTRTPDGRHAFTHLSLQQFFADRDIREADILTKIDDPWWRDAILLWSRRSNVSRVIESCLASGSITALALAYDAAETCGELDPGLLAELRELLSLATKTPTENRLVGAAKVARELSGMAPLFSGARIAVRPISNSLYTSFLESEFPDGRPPPDARESSPATGMWAAESERLLDWVNALPRQDNTRFRLPTEAEVSEPQCDPDIGGRSVWVRDPSGPQLLRAADTPNPYTVARDWWPRVAAQDRHRVTLSLYHLAIVLGTAARPLARDLAGEMDLDRERAWELPRDLKQDTELAASRRFLNSTVLTPGGKDRADPEARAHLDRIIDLVAELAAKALDFRGDRDAPAHDNLPFSFLDRLSSDQHHLLASAVTTLWYACKPPRGRRVRYGETLSNLDGYWTRDIFDAVSRHSRTVPPEKLLATAGDCRELLEHEGETVWHDLARGVLDRVIDRLTSTLSHNTSYTVDDVACARIALTSVAAVMSSHIRQNPHTLRVRDKLAEVQAGLTVLDDRTSGVIVPNEVLLLVRE